MFIRFQSKNQEKFISSSCPSVISMAICRCRKSVSMFLDTTPGQELEEAGWSELRVEHVVTSSHA